MILLELCKLVVLSSSISICTPIDNGEFNSFAECMEYGNVYALADEKIKFRCSSKQTRLRTKWIQIK